MRPFQTDTNNYTLYGALFGICFPIGAIALELFLRDLSFSFASIVYLHQEIILLWMIDSAPLWLGIFARFAGIKQDTVNDTVSHMQNVINERTRNLEEARNEAIKKNLEKSRLSELSQITTRASDAKHLGQRALSFLSETSGTKTGIIYYAENNKLFFLAAYALNQTDKQNAEIDFGETLIGQCAAEKKLLVFNDMPENYLTIGSGIGQSKSHSIALLPIIFEHELQGVLEVGSFDRFSEEDITFLENACEIIGVSLNAAMARKKLSDLVARLEKEALR